MAEMATGLILDIKHHLSFSYLDFFGAVEKKRERERKYIFIKTHGAHSHLSKI